VTKCLGLDYFIYEHGIRSSSLRFSGQLFATWIVVTSVSFSRKKKGKKESFSVGHICLPVSGMRIGWRGSPIPKMEGEDCECS
jgi:hypothetical protein